MAELLDATARLPATEYSPELAEAICETIATTARGMDFLCATKPGWPNPRTVTRWLNEKPEFRKGYELAKERQADLLFFECLEIADDGTGDTKTVERGNGETVEVCDTEWVARSKLRVDTRLKMAGKLAPKKYGDRLDVNAAVGVFRFEDVLAQLT